MQDNFQFCSHAFRENCFLVFFSSLSLFLLFTFPFLNFFLLFFPVCISLPRTLSPTIFPILLSILKRFSLFLLVPHFVYSCSSSFILIVLLSPLSRCFLSFLFFLISLSYHFPFSPFSSLPLSPPHLSPLPPPNRLPTSPPNNYRNL